MFDKIMRPRFAQLLTLKTIANTLFSTVSHQERVEFPGDQF
jgi:hypothetical protein